MSEPLAIKDDGFLPLALDGGAPVRVDLYAAWVRVGEIIDQFPDDGQASERDKALHALLDELGFPPRSTLAMRCVVHVCSQQAKELRKKAEGAGWLPAPAPPATSDSPSAGSAGEPTTGG